MEKAPFVNTTNTVPHAIDTITSNFPKELQALDQWLTWRYETRQGQDKPTKVPYNPATDSRASSTDPATWGSFAEDCAAYERGGFDGLGFVVTEEDPYVAVDIDNCIVDGQLTENALRWIEMLDSYTEITPSQKGVRVWVRGVIPGDRNKLAKLGIEIYEKGRYFTVTGRRLDALPVTIKNRQKELTALYNELFPKEEQTPAAQHRAAPTMDGIPQDDQELLSRMFAARNGYAIRSLWNGDASAHIGADGQPDESSADLALCNHLAFWTGCDEQRMDRLFRQSGLMRPKWDRRARQGETYGQGTIRRAIVNCRSTYDPKRRRQDGDRNNPGAGSSGPKVDVQATINRARQWVKTHNFLPYIDPELLPESGQLRNETTLRRVADAILDVLEEYKSLSGFMSHRELRRRAGIGKSTIAPALARLMPWFVALTDHPQNGQEGAALEYILTFRVNGTHSLSQEDDRGGCPVYAKSPFTLHKAHDAFNIGGNRDMRNAALVYVIGRPAVDALIQLEGYDSPRRAAWADYRAAQKDIEAKGEAVTAEDVSALMRLADGLIDEPQPVTMAALEHLADYAHGIKILSDLGAIFLEGDTVCLDANYGRVLGPLVASLGPTGLLMIDASVEYGDLSYDEFVQHTALKYGTVARAMSKLLKRDIYADDRDGMTKRFTLRADWLSEVEAQAHTMRTYGLQQRREIADATAQYQYVGMQIEAAAQEEQPKLHRRQEKAFNRLLAAVAMDEAGLIQDVSFVRGLRAHLEAKRQPQAPDMPEPTALAWYRLTELTGKGPLGAVEFEEAHRLATVLGADIRMVQWVGDVAPDRAYTPVAHDQAAYPLTRFAEFAELMSARHGQSWAYRLHPATIDARFAAYTEGKAAL